METQSNYNDNSFAERQVFRFKTWRSACQSGWLRIDDTIDRLGVRKLPNTWGRQPDFDRLPLFWRRGRGTVFGLKPTGRSWEREDFIVTPELARLAGDYSDVLKELEKGLRSSVITAIAVGSDGRESHLRPKVYARQRIRIFGAGTVKLHDRILPVWVRKKDFLTWLDERFPQLVKLNLKEWTRLIELLTELHKGKRVSHVNRSQLLELVRRWRGSLSKPDLEDLYAQIPEPARKGGKRDARFDQEVAAVVDQLRKELG